MPHHTPLIATIVAGLGLAFVFGALAHRIKAPPIVGYLLAGVAVGPFTPGFVADGDLATELAEIGVILLMFGVGLHFSTKDLLAVRKIALPGAIVQMAAATLLGMALAWALGWPPLAGFVFGLSLSVASTVVLLRALQERRLVESDRGRIAVGWLIVEDLAMVLALVLLPVLAQATGTDANKPSSGEHWALVLSFTLGKVIAFAAMMLIIGRRVIPWVLHYVAHTGSRELFRLAVLAIALGVAFGAATLFGVSFALGAFFAGMILSESELSQRAAEETLPLRDAFAVLFFVSVGMLFNPAVLVEQPLALLATVAIIVVGKSLAAYAIVRLFKRTHAIALTISASLAQIGEFSFILAALGVSLGLLPPEGRDLVLAGAIASIVLNPIVFRLVDGVAPPAQPTKKAPKDRPAPSTTALARHAVVVGFGRVGQVVADGLRAAGKPVLVVDDRPDVADKAAGAGFEVIVGNAANPAVLAAANLTNARRLFVAIPNGFEAGQVVEQARKTNPDLYIIARAHSEAQVSHLTDRGATETVLGERELARGMLDYALKPDAFRLASSQTESPGFPIGTRASAAGSSAS